MASPDPAIAEVSVPMMLVQHLIFFAPSRSVRVGHPGASKCPAGNLYVLVVVYAVTHVQQQWVLSHMYG